ncbi:MAG: cytochrome b/b6 domain-containing protein [Gammaproteobacteria bacterium]|nr:cytochrome b/b6 domain-containing protein [Gammaproteobacteria bacterium]
MSKQIIHRTLVWSGKLRAAHWTLSLSSLVLILTGWLIPIAPSITHLSNDWHYLAAAVFITVLLFRLWMLFSDSRSAGITALMPGKQALPAIGQMLRFYITLGKAPLPSWYAHNPLWAPIYLFSILVMLLLAATGLAMDEYPILFSIYLPELHSTLASIFTIFVAAHVITVFIHDAKGTSSDISAMVNGHRIFVVQKAGNPDKDNIQHISLDGFGK